MADEVLPIKEEATPPATPPTSEDTATAPTSNFTFENFYRRFIPPNTATVGRDLKLRNLFTLSGAVASNGTVVTVSTDASGTTQTNLAVFKINKNEWHVGMVIRVTVLGSYTADGTRIVSIYNGSSTGAQTAGSATGTGNTTWNTRNSTAGAASGAPWHIQWYTTVNAIGTSGLVTAQWMGTINDVVKDATSASTFAVDTTVDQTLTLSAIWSANNAGNSVVVRQFLVEVLN